MGHIVTSPLQPVSGITEAETLAAARRANEATVPGSSEFFMAPWGAIAVTWGGDVREAEFVGRADGSRWIVQR